MLTALMLMGLAGAAEFPVTVMGGVSSATGEQDGEVTAGGAGVGRVLVSFGQFGLDFSGRAGLMGNGLREVSGLGAGLRWSPGLLYVRAGLVHQHETDWDVLMGDPLGAVAGSASGIVHRSGAELAVGLHGRPFGELLGGRLGVYGEVSGMAYSNRAAPPVYVNLDVGVSVGLGRRR